MSPVLKQVTQALNAAILLVQPAHAGISLGPPLDPLDITEILKTVLLGLALLCALAWLTGPKPKKNEGNRSSVTGEGSENMSAADAEVWINNELQKHPFLMFSSAWCPYCVMAKNALSAAGLSKQAQKPHIIELDSDPNGPVLRQALGKITGATSVPRVFIGGTFLGGGNETAQAQREGRLEGLLRAAGALSN